MNKKIVFMGTPDFAVPTLNKIHSVFGVTAVVTIPDKPQGRGLKLVPSPIKVAANELGIALIQPQSLKEIDFIEEIKEINPDIIVVVAFKILPKEVYTIPKISSFNIHGSILPKYRGAAPINHTILNGEKSTGVTSFILQDKVDTGNIILKKEIVIPDNSTAGDLFELLKPLSADCAIETIELLINGDYTIEKQDDSKATAAPKIQKENCKIDFNNSSDYLQRFINHISPIPGAFTVFNSKKLKVFRTHISDKKLNIANYQIDNNEFLIGTKDFALKIEEIQPEGKNITKVTDFIRGFRGEKNGMVD